MLNHGYSYREQVGAEGRGLSVAQYLVRRHRHSSAAIWEARIVQGEVEVGQHRAAVDELLTPGAWLTWHRPPWDEPDVPLDFRVVAEEEHLLAVDKPSGLPTMPAGGFLEGTLLAQVQKRDPRWTPVHRLGRGTSGLVLFARGAEALGRLTGAWREGQVDKRYLGVASGHPAWTGKVIDAPIGRVPYSRLGTLFAASPGGRSARSEVEVLEQGKESFLASVRIFTGRPHQIRIHLAWAGHPLRGDPLYGEGGSPRIGIEALPGDLGYMLHAHRLTVPHPASGAPVTFTAEPPPGCAAT